MATSGSGAPSNPVSESGRWDGNFNFVLGVDGQSHARAAYDGLIPLVTKADRITMVHVVNQSSAEALPYDARPAYVREYYESRTLSRLPKSQWSFQAIAKEPASTTSKSFLRYLQRMPATDFLVVGFGSMHGDRLGSVTDGSLREAHMPVIIQKGSTSGGAAPDHNVFVVAVDGGEWAHHGVELALRLAAIRPGVDEVFAIHIEDLTAQSGGGKKYDADFVEARYKDYAATHPALTFRRVVKSTAVSVPDSILAQAEEVGATYVILGVDRVAKLAQGKGDHFIGSVTDRVVKGAHCSVIVIQAKQGTYVEGVGEHQ
jgi:nucleotide-binding universal stress UspA family protein